MKLNRRTFFQAAALLPAAVLQSKGQAFSQRTAAQPPLVEVDLAEPGAAEYVECSATDLFVRLEELDPADPGELSGATLRIGDAREYLSLTAGIGDVLQRGGYRTSHWLGYVEGEDVRLLASFDPIGSDREFRVFLSDPRHAERAYSVSVVLYPGESPELHLNAACHCLGVLRGALLLQFLDCLRRRSVREDSRTF